jgi:hypothetical protein
MIRVTKLAGNITDQKEGTILLNPVFKPQRLTRAIFALGLEDVCGIQYSHGKIAERKDAEPTLVIKKVPALTEGKIDALIKALTETGAMQTHKTISQWASRIARGHSRM